MCANRLKLNKNKTQFIWLRRINRPSFAASLSRSEVSASRYPAKQCLWEYAYCSRVRWHWHLMSDSPTPVQQVLLSPATGEDCAQIKSNQIKFFLTQCTCNSVWCCRLHLPPAAVSKAGRPHFFLQIFSRYCGMQMAPKSHWRYRCARQYSSQSPLKWRPTHVWFHFLFIGKCHGVWSKKTTEMRLKAGRNVRWYTQLSARVWQTDRQTDRRNCCSIYRVCMRASRGNWNARISLRHSIYV